MSMLDTQHRPDRPHPTGERQPGTHEPHWDELSARLTGQLLLPDDPGYAALVGAFNLTQQPHPVAVVQAASADDVVAAVRFAGRYGIEIAPQATGHGAVDALDGALLIHTGLLQELQIHPEGWARIGAGIRWQQVLDAAAPFDLMGLAGSSPNVGVVGYVTGGGLSPLAHAYGFAADRVRALDLVTADGMMRRVTPESEPDLFWAVRGGKGSVGIVTAVDLDLLHGAAIYGGAVWFDGADAGTVLRTWRTWGSDLPDGATTSIAFMRLPEAPFVPPPLAGKLTVSVRFTWTGDAHRGARLLAPLRACAPAVIDTVDLIPATALGQVHSDPTDPMPVLEDHVVLEELTHDTVETLLEQVIASPALVMVEVRRLGGALAWLPRHASAISHRDAPFSLFTLGLMIPPIADLVSAQVAALTTAMRPWSRGRTLVNFAPLTCPERVTSAYDPATLARLRRVSAHHDPHGILRARRFLDA